jgi:hypothetical protein
VKAFLIVADAARVHPDGTFSLLRGGITTLTTEETKPAVLKASVMARISVDPGEQGPHEFKIQVINEDGLQVMPDYSGNFDAPPKGGSVNLVADLQLIFPKPGRYAFNLFVDKRMEHSWAMDVLTKPPASPSDRGGEK